MAADRRYLELDPAAFAEGFPDRPFRLRHRLADHPLFRMERLLELACALPERQVEYNAGTLAVSQDPALTPMTGLTIAETVRRIEECESWMALKYVERDPAYRELLDACVAEIRPLAEARRGGLHQAEGYIFISSPHAVTPYHIDDEHNFLLQVAGGKTVRTWDGRDPEVLRPEEIERGYIGGHRNLVYREGLAAHGTAFDLGPGDGLHIPAHGPHWVRNGPSVSVSFSVTFRSAALSREATIHWFNGHLRKRGLKPRPYARSAVADAVKYPVARATRLALDALRRGKAD